ncbi:MAG: EexN family lipoprotein [Proteobacteria bacterium]|nr:EexN family lipoprotein [Pseudomonadota bacterium]
MAIKRLEIICGSLILLAGCAKEPPPRTVAEFLDNRILLEATMVHCGKNRNMSKYEAECVNAREAINRIATIEEEDRRAELEAQSARKRKALRRTQQAAAEARRRAADARRRRAEEEYLGVFEGQPPDAGTDAAAGNVQRPDDPGGVEQAPADASQPAGEVGQDLESIREELRRRQDSE